MCGSSKKTEDTTAHSVTTPNVPDWISQPFQGVSSQVQNLMGQDPASFVPGASPLQTAAWTQAGSLSPDPYGAFSGAAKAVTGAQPVTAAVGQATTYDPSTVGQAATYDPSTVGTASHTTSGSLLDNLQAYMNPVTNDVVRTTLNDFDQSAGQRRAADDLLAAKNSALPGSGFALQKSLTEGELSRAREAADASLRYKAFDTGAALSNQDAQRRQDAGVFNAGADNTVSLADAAARNTAGQVNAGAQNTVNAGDQAARNAAGAFGAGAKNTVSLADQAAKNTVATGNADRNLQGASILGALGTAAGANDRANVSTLDTLGQDQRSVQTEQAQAPISILSQLQQILQGIPVDSFSGKTTDSTGHGVSTQTANTMDQLLSLVKMFSGNIAEAVKGGSGGGAGAGA